MHTNVSHVPVVLPGAVTQRSFTLSSFVVVSPVSVRMLSSLQPPDVGYIASHAVSAGQRTARPSPWFTPYAARAPQQSSWCTAITQLSRHVLPAPAPGVAMRDTVASAAW